MQGYGIHPSHIVDKMRTGFKLRAAMSMISTSPSKYMPTSIHVYPTFVLDTEDCKAGT